MTFGVAGLAGAAVLVHLVGAEEILEAIARAAPWAPIALAIEGTRGAVEARVTHWLFARLGRPISGRRALRAQLLAYAVFVLSPAGRATAELAKAGILAKPAGAEPAAVVATVAQGAALLGTALVAFGCALAAAVYPGGWALATAIAVQGLGAAGVGSAILWASHRETVGRVIRRLLRWAGLDEARREGAGPLARRLPALPLRALAGFTVSRGLEVALFGVLLVAVGAHAGAAGGLRAMGASLVGTVAVDLVPADIGLIEGMLALFHQEVGVTRAQGVAVGVLFHAVQITWVAVSGLAAILWPENEDAEAEPRREDRDVPA